MDPPPPPGHIRVVEVDVIDDDIIQLPHDHRELPHRAVQSEAGITDGRRAVMPRRHRDECDGKTTNLVVAKKKGWNRLTSIFFMSAPPIHR